MEMDILDALDEIRSLNARQSKMDPLEVLIAKQLEEEAEVKCVVGVGAREVEAGGVCLQDLVTVIYTREWTGRI